MVSKEYKAYSSHLLVPGVGERETLGTRLKEFRFDTCQWKNSVFFYRYRLDQPFLLFPFWWYLIRVSVRPFRVRILCSSLSSEIMFKELCQLQQLSIGYRIFGHLIDHHHQFLLSLWRIGPEIILLQDTLFAAASPASTQELKLIVILSFTTVLLHVSLGLPLLRFPSDARVRATCGRQLLSMGSTCPMVGLHMTVKQG